MNDDIQRVSVASIDSILGHKLSVLDKGFVRVIDYMGGDESIVQAARISYGRGTKKLSEDEGLIRYLLRHAHTTPFEMCEIKLHIKIPMDCWRQFIRHRTANVNEYSTRYSEAIDDKQETKPNEWRLQSATNKQGSGASIDPLIGAELTHQEMVFQTEAAQLYARRLAHGVAKEQARKDLPLSTYTEAYWKIDLHNLLHFLSLRMDKHAQLEIRSYAEVMAGIVEQWCPMTWRAFNDYHFRRDALLLTARDKQVVFSIARGHLLTVQLAVAHQFGWLEKREDGSLKDNRERIECEAKLKDLGFKVPWEK